MIAIDWGTSSFRAFRFSTAGEIIDRRSCARGILHVLERKFEAALREQIGDWLADGESRIIMSGMIGSRQGWVEVPYVPCPAGPAEIAAALVRIPFDGATVLLVPGLSATDESGTPEVMRGEETQVIGALRQIGDDGVVCLPGSHSKWVRISGGKIVSFQTYLTGEMFSALRSATILGRMMTDGPIDLAAFNEGVARSAEPSHLLHHLFGVRTLGLFGKLADAQGASYLSGLLIGHEVRSALGADEPVHVIGTGELTRWYIRAITACGGSARSAPEDSAAWGLARLSAQSTKI
jgi:2-dehydro-3-deoxygalactonokinase